MPKSILRPPRLRTAETEEEEHRVTWLELFYDLVFVVAVAGLGRRLLVNISWSGVGEFVGLFIPLWWAWAGFTFYADRYDTDDLGQRLLAVAQMVAITLLAVSIAGDVADSTMAFALAYVGARLVLIAMYTRAWRHVTETRTLVGGYIKGFSVGAAIWLVSAFVPEPGRFFLWAVGLAVEFATPYVLRRIQAKVPLDVSHLPERFGLFTILVLGESIAAAAAALAHREWDAEGIIAGALSVVIASGLWWLYFDNLEGSVVRRDPSVRKAWRPTVWIYSHLPLVISLTATAIGLEAIVAEAGHELHTAERWLAAGGFAASLFFMGMIQVATVSNHPREHAVRARFRFICAGLALFVGLIGGSFNALVVAILIALLCAVQVAVDVVISES